MTELDFEFSCKIDVAATIHSEPFECEVKEPDQTLVVKLVSTLAGKTTFDVVLKLRLSVPTSEDSNLGDWKRQLEQNGFAYWFAGNKPAPPLYPMRLIYDSFRRVAWKVALATEQAPFAMAYDGKNPNDVIRDVVVKADGQEFPLKPNPDGPRHTFQLGKGLRPLGPGVLKAAVEAPWQGFESWAVRADMEWTRKEDGYVFLNLATMLETTGYRALRDRLHREPSDTEDFSPTLYLGAKNVLKKQPSFERLDKKGYLACRELWGARHEFVHRGRIQIRTGGSRNGKLRSVTGEDLQAFRSGALGAAGWMVTP